MSRKGRSAQSTCGASKKPSGVGKGTLASSLSTASDLPEIREAMPCGLIREVPIRPQSGKRFCRNQPKFIRSRGAIK